MNNLELCKTRLNFLVAYARNNRVIGKNNDLPWKRKLKADLAFLNYITTRQKTAIIMGRCTFESIGRKLPGRLNIILTSQKIEDVDCYAKLDDAIMYCKENGYLVVIFGGERVYKEALKHEHKLFCTIVEDEFTGDAFFPMCDDKLINISKQVHAELVQNGTKQTWILKDDLFEENEIKFGFYTSE